MAEAQIHQGCTEFHQKISQPLSTKFLAEKQALEVYPLMENTDLCEVEINELALQIVCQITYMHI